MADIARFQFPSLATGEQGFAAKDHVTNESDADGGDSTHIVSRIDETRDLNVPEGQLGAGAAEHPAVPHSLFSQSQKLQITILVSLASVLSPMSATIYVPALPTIADDLGVSVALVNLSVTSYMIFQGLSPSLWSSLTDVLGRRPVYLFTLVIYVGTCLGLSFTTNYAELIVLRCLQSTGSASTIAIGAGVIGDITQRKERGGYIGFYSAGSLVANALGPILGGIFAQTVGWHAIFYFLAALASCLVFVLFLALPETLRAIVGNGSLSPGKTVFSRPVFDILMPTNRKEGSAVCTSRPKQSVDLLGPVKMMGEHDILCGLLLTALIYTVWQASLVASSSLFESDYSLDEISVGLSFIASGVGCVSASLLTGKVLNYDYRQALEREKSSRTGELARIVTEGLQVEQLEHARLRRLPVIIAIFVMAALAFAWCIGKHTTIALPIIWTFFGGFTATATMGMFSTLIVDYYPESGASATAALNLVRCLMGAGGTAVVQPMISRIGVGWTFTVGAAIVVAASPLGLLIWLYGERWRHRREERIHQPTELADSHLRLSTGDHDSGVV